MCFTLNRLNYEKKAREKNGSNETNTAQKKTLALKHVCQCQFSRKLVSEIKLKLF